MSRFMSKDTHPQCSHISVLQQREAVKMPTYANLSYCMLRLFGIVWKGINTFSLCAKDCHGRAEKMHEFFVKNIVSTETS